MKSLSASLLMVSAFLSNLSAQSQPTSSTTLSDADRAIIQSWSEQASQTQEARIEGDRLILPIDERNAMCAFLRVYRVKRERPGSDLTRPAGYTTCVGASRFTMKSSAKPKVQQTPMENAQAK
ncbi:MAG TPA: hypothetical protein VFA40_18780 [Terriglobales bacterium]|nr:hypothetical protein [Terriglobales bacterium]